MTIWEGESNLDWVEKERIVLSNYKTKQELHALMVEKGFQLRPKEEIERVRHQRQEERVKEEERNQIKHAAIKPVKYERVKYKPLQKREHQEVKYKPTASVDDRVESERKKLKYYAEYEPVEYKPHQRGESPVDDRVESERKKLKYHVEYEPVGYKPHQRSESPETRGEYEEVKFESLASLEQGGELTKEQLEKKHESVRERLEALKRTEL